MGRRENFRLAWPLPQAFEGLRETSRDRGDFHLHGYEQDLNQTPRQISGKLAESMLHVLLNSL